MPSDGTSLDRLHDIAVPGDVPLWPPAPGWYLVLAASCVATLLLSFRAWQYWKSKSYRRAALRELSSLEDAAAIAQLLRRTALAILPRDVVVDLTGAEWVDWLTGQYSAAMPFEVRVVLAEGIYQRAMTACDPQQLREYAAGWITQHQLVCEPRGKAG
jgi:hypothetical protein